ncbi:MAG: sugar phosphate isomerase/epimerase [Firmicutes bacterium]|nr:sugar phosphate isomerase/epimerase [Bacillota bacterium]
MMIGCQMVAFAAELPESLYWALEKVAAMGFLGVEVGARFVDEPSRFAEFIKGVHLDIAGLHTGADLWNSAVLKSSQNSFVQVAKLAEDLNCPRIILSGMGPQDRKLSDEGLRVQAEVLNKLGVIASEHGAKVLYHNHGWEFMDDERVIGSIVEFTDPAAVGLAVDLGWAEHAGRDPVEVMGKYQERIEHIHIRDLRHDKFVELGNGKTDLNKIIRKVSEIGYSGWLIVEMEPHAPSYGGSLEPAESIAVGYGFLQGILHKRS